MELYKKLDNLALRGFIFHPRQTTKTPTSIDHLDVDITVEDDIVLGCRIFIHDISSPTIFYFHGNGETVEDYEMIAPFYINSGLNFLVFTYRGYGWSQGVPTVSSMMSDCHACFTQAQEHLHAQGFSGPILVMGRSIGSASAIEVCATQNDKIVGLIIESGFADTLPLLANLGVTKVDKELTEEDGFRNRDKISSIKTPTLILHGAMDSIIPASQAERLQIFCGARKKKFFMIPGADHNSTIQLGGDLYFSTILDFVNDVTGVEIWKQRKKYRDRRKNDA